MKDGTESTVIKDAYGDIANITLVSDSYFKYKRLEYSYCKNRQISEIKDIANINSTSSTEITKYNYDDESGELDSINVGDMHTEHYTYNDDNQIAEKRISNASGYGHTYTYAYTSDSKKTLSSIGVNGNTVNIKTDALGRIAGKTVIGTVTDECCECEGTYPDEVFTERISYIKHGDHATNIPSVIRYSKKSDGNTCFGETLSYKYDSMGNITEVLENGLTIARYEYDTLGRLTREDNKAFGKTYRFVYDNKGNILAYTL